MRKVIASPTGRATFIIFAAIIVVILGAISFFVVRSFASPVQTYTVPTGAVLYDKDDQYIKLESSGNVSKNWAGEWELKTEDKTTYDLGEGCVMFDTGASKVTVFGDGYRVFEDGSVEKIADKTDLIDLQKAAFYKLADRKYLMIGADIKEAEGRITADKYAIVRLDKSGRAWLLNDEMNLKTIDALTLVSAEISFDVANEKLLVDNGSETPFVIDLKRIIGSTNEYDPSLDKDALAQRDAEENGPVATDGGNEVSGGAAGGAGGSASSSASSGSSGNKSNNATKKYAPSLVLTKAVGGVTSMTLGYSAYDPSGTFATVYALIARVNDGETGTAQRVLLNAGSSTKTIYDLDPNAVYQVTLGYTTFKGEDKATDFVNVQTQPIASSISVPRLSASKISCNVRLDPGYALDRVTLALYCDGTKISSQEVPVSQAMTLGGWTTTFANPGTQGSTCMLVFENASYNGREITLPAKCTIRNNAVTVTQ